MSNELKAVLGMTIAYGASLLGMIFAYVGYRRQQREKENEGNGDEL